jgi:hypothetical protein
VKEYIFLTVEIEADDRDFINLITNLGHR